MKEESSAFCAERCEKVSGFSSCAFTGHRSLGRDFDREKLKRTIRERILDGVKVFYCGMAVGFDLAAAECVVELKSEVPSVVLVACIPCIGQEKFFGERDKRRYERLVGAADVKVILSDKYYSGCMLRRNEYMEEKADILICYCRKSTGGTAFTVELFKRKNKKIFSV